MFNFIFNLSSLLRVGNMTCHTHGLESMLHSNLRREHTGQLFLQQYLLSLLLVLHKIKFPKIPSMPPQNITHTPLFALRIPYPYLIRFWIRKTQQTQAMHQPLYDLTFKNLTVFTFPSLCVGVTLISYWGSKFLSYAPTTLNVCSFIFGGSQFVVVLGV